MYISIVVKLLKIIFKIDRMSNEINIYLKNYEFLELVERFKIQIRHLKPFIFTKQTLFWEGGCSITDNRKYNLRSHNRTIHREKMRYFRPRFNFLTNRVTTIWNKEPIDIVNAQSLLILQGKIGRLDESKLLKRLM